MRGLRAALPFSLLLLARCTCGGAPGSTGLGVPPVPATSIVGVYPEPVSTPVPPGSVPSTAIGCPADQPVLCPGEVCCPAAYRCPGPQGGGCTLPSAGYPVQCAYLGPTLKNEWAYCVAGQSCAGTKTSPACSRLATVPDGGVACPGPDGGFAGGCPPGATCAGGCAAFLPSRPAVTAGCPAGSKPDCGGNVCCPDSATCGASGCGCGGSAPVPCGSGCCATGDACTGDGGCLKTVCPADHPTACGDRCCLSGGVCFSAGVCTCPSTYGVLCGNDCCEAGAFCDAATGTKCEICPTGYPIHCNTNECCSAGETCEYCPGDDGPHCRDTPCPCPSGQAFDPSTHKCVSTGGGGSSCGNDSPTTCRGDFNKPCGNGCCHKWLTCSHGCCI